MQDANKLTDITLVIYPSNHILIPAPKIVLVGSGTEWKEEVVKEANNYWTTSPVLFYYLDDEPVDTDRLSWLYLNIKESDFVVGMLSDDIFDISIISPFIFQNKTFCMFGDLPNDLVDWYMTLNPNSELNTPLSIILEIKNIWSKKQINTNRGLGQ